MTLTEFLKARIAEDEAQGCRCDCFEGSARECDTAWRAECEAKRRIVEIYASKYFPPVMDLPLREPQRMILALAQPYADHPDFDPSWGTP